MMRRSILVLPFGIALVLLLALFGMLQPVAAQEPVDPIVAAVGYLSAQQQADGGITGFSGTSDPDTTARAILGLSVNGEPLRSLVPSTGLSMLNYLESQAISYTHDLSGTLLPGRAGLYLAAVSAGGGSIYNFGGMDLVSELEGTFHWSSGAYSTTASDGFASGAASDLTQAWAVLGLSLAGQPVPAQAAGYLLTSQADDGSWGFGDPDTTALAVTALMISKHVAQDDPAFRDALIFFHRTQLANGGWRPSWDTDPLNADSTGWVLQALYSAGEDLSTWAGTEGDPVGSLLALQKPDGSIGGTYANTYSTAEALLGLGGRSLIALALPPQLNRAGLVVQFAEGRVMTACIRFGEDSLSGYDLLVRSGLVIGSVTDPMQGVGVCEIENTGCPASDCFCSMPNYWSYWQPGPTGWAYAVTGSMESVVTNGSVEAWSWGEGIAPPFYAYQDLCGYGDAPVSVDGATATPTPDLPPATETAEHEASATSTPVQPEASATTAPVVPSTTPTDEVSAEASSNGTVLLFFGVLLLGLGVGTFLLRKRKPR